MYAEEFKVGSSEMYRFSLRLGECRRRGGDGGAERRASESRSARRSGAEMETVGTWHDVSTGTVREKEKGEYGGGGRERTERDRERERERDRGREREPFIDTSCAGKPYTDTCKADTHTCEHTAACGQPNQSPHTYSQAHKWHGDLIQTERASSTAMHLSKGSTPPTPYSSRQRMPF